MKIEELLSEILSTQPFDFDEMNRLSDKQPQPPNWVYWSFCIEALIIVFSAIWALFCAQIFYKHPIFHKNLIALAGSIFFLWWAMQISRLVVCIGAMFVDLDIGKNLSVFLVKPPFNKAEYFRAWTGYAAVSSMIAIVVERVMATKRLDFYERVTSPLFIGFLIIICWLIGTVGTILIFHSPVMVVLSIVLGITLIVIVGLGFVYVKRRNLYLLRQSKLHSSLYNLSQIYQIRENIKVLSIIRRFIITFLACLSVLFVVFIFGLFSQSANEKSNIQLYLVRSFGNLTCDIVGSIMIYSAITGTHIWRQELYRQVCSIFTFKRRSPIVSIKKESVHVQNSDGKILAFSINEEQDIYFEQLKHAWN